MLGLVDGAIPFVVTRLTIATLRCAVPVLPDGGDGAMTASLAERTARCRHRTVYLVGRAPTCPHHLRDVVGIAGQHDDSSLAPHLQRLPWELGECA